MQQHQRAREEFDKEKAKLDQAHREELTKREEIHKEELEKKLSDARTQGSENETLRLKMIEEVKAKDIVIGQMKVKEDNKERFSAELGNLKEDYETKLTEKDKGIRELEIEIKDLQMSAKDEKRDFERKMESEKMKLENEKREQERKMEAERIRVLQEQQEQERQRQLKEKDDQIRVEKDKVEEAKTRQAEEEAKYKDFKDTFLKEAQKDDDKFAQKCPALLSRKEGTSPGLLLIAALKEKSHSRFQRDFNIPLKREEEIENRSKGIAARMFSTKYPPGADPGAPSGFTGAVRSWITPEQKGARFNKTIMLLGLTGAGKTTFIDAFINYVFDIRFEDKNRLRLVSLTKEERDKQDKQAHSQTDHIVVYKIKALPEQGTRLHLKSYMEPPGGCYFIVETYEESSICCFDSNGKDCETSVNYTPRNNSSCQTKNSMRVLSSDSETNTCVLVMTDPLTGYYQSFKANHQQLQQCHVLTENRENQENEESGFKSSSKVILSLLVVFVCMLLSAVGFAYTFYAKEKHQYEKKYAHDVEEEILLNQPGTQTRTSTRLNLKSRKKQGRYKRPTPLHSTPLVVAATQGNKDTVEALLKEGVTQEGGNTALHMAVIGYYPDKKEAFVKIVEHLLEKGASAKSFVKGHTPLHTAVHKNSLEIVKLLAKDLAKERSRDKKEETALQLAVRLDRRDIVEFLILHDKSWNANKDEIVKTVYPAVAGGHKNTLDALIRVGKLDWDKYSGSCLLRAVRENNRPAVNFLFGKHVPHPSEADRKKALENADKNRLKYRAAGDKEKERKTAKSIVEKLMTSVAADQDAEVRSVKSAESIKQKSATQHLNLVKPPEIRAAKREYMELLKQLRGKSKSECQKEMKEDLDKLVRIQNRLKELKQEDGSESGNENEIRAKREYMELLKQVRGRSKADSIKEMDEDLDKFVEIQSRLKEDGSGSGRTKQA